MASERKIKAKEFKTKIEETQKELIEKNIKDNKSIQKLESNLEKLQKESAKIKILYVSRISEYAKELSFWRDTIRKIMYNSESKNLNSELIIDTVIKSLKTYHTRNQKDIEFTTLEILDKLSKK